MAAPSFPVESTSSLPQPLRSAFGQAVPPISQPLAQSIGQSLAPFGPRLAQSLPQTLRQPLTQSFGQPALVTSTQTSIQQQNHSALQRQVQRPMQECAVSTRSPWQTMIQRNQTVDQGETRSMQTNRRRRRKISRNNNLTQTISASQQYVPSQTSLTSSVPTLQQVTTNDNSNSNQSNINDPNQNFSVFDKSILINTNVSITMVLKRLLKEKNIEILKQHAIKFGALTNELTATNYCNKLIDKYGAAIYWDIKNIIDNMDLIAQRNLDMQNPKKKRKM